MTCAYWFPKFKRLVEPGDQLILRATIQRSVKGVIRFDAEATVDGELVAKAEILAALREPGS